jgi:hypothetical protein
VSRPRPRRASQRGGAPVLPATVIAALGIAAYHTWYSAAIACAVVGVCRLYNSMRAGLFRRANIDPIDPNRRG